MPIIANDKFESMLRDGRARMDRPGRLQMQPKKPKKEPRGLSLLQSMRDSIKGLSEKDTGENIQLLQRIEALLKQLIVLYSMPKQDNPPAVVPPPNWHFVINRDSKGRMESVDAIRQPPPEE